MRKKIFEAIEAVRPFVPLVQMKSLVDGIRWSEERGFFREKVLALAEALKAMPVTYAQSELGEDAVVHLHYFYGGCDWWITEKDVKGGVDQAFGMVDLGHGAELGYISIRELRRMAGVELDLHWTPKTLKEIRLHREKPAPVAPAARSKPSVANVVDIAVWFAEKPTGLVH
ncbi:MAG: DUF2958 domain-containing protein [Rhodoferax sp.]|nr:DUF2958 domain-containing protein [Rhodoferax sp.]